MDINQILRMRIPTTMKTIKKTKLLFLKMMQNNTDTINMMNIKVINIHIHKTQLNQVKNNTNNKATLNKMRKIIKRTKIQKEEGKIKISKFIK